MNGVFGECSSLKYLPDISKWNTTNVKQMIGLFYKCTSLSILPDISNWKTNNIINISSLFEGCSSLTTLPDISTWNIDNLLFIDCMFKDCSSLYKLPNLSKWRTIIDNNDVNSIFDGCLSLRYNKNYKYFNDSMFDSIRKKHSLYKSLSSSSLSIKEGKNNYIINNLYEGIMNSESDLFIDDDLNEYYNSFYDI